MDKTKEKEKVMAALRYLSACGYGGETIDELLDKLEWEERKRLKMN